MTVTVNITLSPQAAPPTGLPTAVRIGNAPDTSVRREGNTITATFRFPAGPTRTVDVIVTFGSPQSPDTEVTYRLTDGFTIN